MCVDVDAMRVMLHECLLSHVLAVMVACTGYVEEAMIEHTNAKNKSTEILVLKLKREWEEGTIMSNGQVRQVCLVAVCQL